jgi:hypothetical protein
VLELEAGGHGQHQHTADHGPKRRKLHAVQVTESGAVGGGGPGKPVLEPDRGARLRLAVRRAAASCARASTRPPTATSRWSGGDSNP